jgi:tape measure domain-containing protein
MSDANIRAVISAKDDASHVLKKFGDNVSSVGDSIGYAAKRAVQGLSIAGTAAATFAVKSAADFQQASIAFETMLGSAEASKKMLKDLSDFSLRTPFELPQVVDGAKKLLAYGITAENILPDFEALGNIAAGVGRDKLPFLTLAFGQVATKGKLAGQEIRQFTEAGVPLVQELAKSMRKTTVEIQAMSENGEISFDDVRKSIKGMSGEGGKFFKLMEKQSKSFSGVVSNIRDSIGRLARSAVGISDTGEIREGSIFAQLQTAATNLFNYLNTNRDKIEVSLKQGLDWIVNVGIPAAIQLFKDLWPTIKAVGNILIDVFTFLKDNTWVLWGIVAVFTAIKVAMFLQGALAAFQVVIGGAIAAYGGLAAVVASPLILPALGIAAALASIAAVVLALDSVRDSINAVNGAAKAASNLGNGIDVKSMQQQARAAYASGNKARGDQLVAAIKASGGGGYAMGGYTGQGGTNEVAGVVHKGEYVVPQSQVDQGTGKPKGMGTVNININLGTYAGSQMELRKLATTLMGAYNDAKSMGTA